MYILKVMLSGILKHSISNTPKEHVSFLFQSLKETNYTNYTIFTASTKQI